MAAGWKHNLKMNSD